MRSNFQFMESIDPTLYDKLVIAEKALYTSRKLTGHALRRFWEKFTADLLVSYGIYNDLSASLQGKAPTLGERMDFFTKPHPALRTRSGYYFKLEELNRKRENKIPVFCDAPIDATITSRHVSGRPSRYYDKTRKTQYPISLLYFLRQYCNDCTHEETDIQPPVFDVNFVQTLDYMTQLHKFLRKFYGLAPAPYDEKIIIFNKFEVIGVNSSPDDGFRTGCIKECTALYYPTTGFSKTLPAIIRFFPKKDQDRDFASRSAGVNSLLDKNACGKGLRNIIELADMDSDSEFYIIAYVFENEASALSNELLRNTPYTTRLVWCKEIAAIVNNLHTNDPKIFHRLINHNSIYLVKSRDGDIHPSLIKMSFAKIIDAGAPTVFGITMSAAKQIKQRQSAEMKYLSGEFSNCPAHNPENTALVERHWEKVDIFALGILLSDILCADISTVPHSKEALQSAGASEAVCDIILRCREDRPDSRPTASEVLDKLNHN